MANENQSTTLHIIKDGNVTLDNILLDIHSEVIKEFPDRESLWHYVDEQRENYEQLIPLGITDPRSIPDVYIIQLGEK